MTDNQKVVVRFPPSPTGLLHMGNVRTALYNYLFARKNGGAFLIRVEDTDRLRSKKEYETNMFESMKWLGLEHDNQGQEWRQTERIDTYKKYLDKLIEAGVAYIAEEQKVENEENILSATKNHEERRVVRFKNPGGKIKFHDLIRGEIEIEVDSLGDFVIARNINEPLYHLAVVIDDLESGITHIIRGEDHISNTPRQILIWKAITEVSKVPFDIPEYAHLPMILAPDKSKLSKRKHGEMVSLKFYRDKGYEPGAIINFLALIGWNPGTDQEIFSLDQLIKIFDLTKVQKKGAIFNVEKLDWLNREYILQQPKEEQFSIFNLQVSNSKFKDHPKTKDTVFMEKLLKIMLDRIHRWGEVGEILAAGEFNYLFEGPAHQKDRFCWKNQSLEDAKKNLREMLAIINSQTSDEEIKKRLIAFAEEKGRGEVFWPLRYALSGQEKSPDPITLFDIIGVAESEQRLKAAINILEN